MKRTGLETYRALCLSTAHLPLSERYSLHKLMDNMAAARDTGYFVKLYEEREYNITAAISKELQRMLLWAHDNHFRLIEFDRDVESLDIFPTFEEGQFDD